MNLFKKISIFSLAAMLSLGFVGCSDEDASSESEQAKQYKNTTATFSCSCTGNIFKLVDLSTKVYVNDVESKKFTSDFSNNSLKVVINELAPESKVEVKVLAERNSTAVDANLTYDHKVTPMVTVTRNFTDGTSEIGGTRNFNSTSVGGIDKESIEEYIEQYGSDEYTFSLDKEGDLNAY